MANNARKREDGGSAFPRTEAHPSYDFPLDHPGMSLRDYFAGRALSVLADSVMKSGCDEGFSPTKAAAVAAKASYCLADAMIAARQNGGAS